VETIQANVTGKKAAADPRDAPKARRIPEACRVLGISRSTVYRLAAQGRIRLVHVGSRTLVPETEVDRLASEGA
jgi:excisionase family DNA binding protein